MADVDITSLSVEISAESGGAELNINKLATAISNLRTKANVGSICTALDTLSTSIENLKTSSKGMNGLTSLTKKLNALSQTGDISHVADGINSLKSSLSGMNITQQAKDLGTLQRALSALPAATTGLGNAGLGNLEPKINKLVSAIKPLSNIDTSGIKALNSSVNALGKVPDLTKKLDAKVVDEFSTACQKISDALTPLASQLEKVGNAFAKMPAQLGKVVTQANRVAAANQKTSKSYMSLSAQMSTFMKRAAQLVSLKAIATYIGNAIVKFNDFYEATDLFNNAMGNLSDEASSLVGKMQELLGIDPKDAMEHIATIQSLATSFGLASDKAYILSKNLMQLAYDEASYWNKDGAETFTAISSAISGELEPIRRLGVDLSQARLQQELLALGFNKQVSSLSQADKAVLRYIAIMKQTTNIQGNLAQTITSPANQIRMLKAELDQLAKSVGSLLYPALSSILPPLIAAVELIKEFVQWVAKLMGIDIKFTDFSKVQSDVGGVSDALDDTADSTKKAAKALKDYTMGFDELNIIDPTQGSSSSGSGSGASGNILGDVDLSGYDMFKDYVGNSVDEIKAKFESMKGVIAAIGVSLAGLSLAKFLTDVSNAIAKMSELQKLALSIATVVIEAALVFQFSKDYASSGNPIELLGEIVSAAFGSFVLWKAIGADGISLGMGVAFVASLAGLTYALGTGSASLGNASAWIQALLTTAFGSVAGATLLSNLGVAAGTAATLSIGLAGLFTFTGITFSVGEKLNDYPILNNIITALMAVFGGAAGAGIALLVGASVPVAGALIAAGVGIGLVLHWAGIKWGKKSGSEETDAAKEANDKMAALEDVFETKIENIKQIIVEKWNAAIDFMTTLPSKVGEIVTGIVEWFSNLPGEIGYALGFAVGKIGEWVWDMVSTVVTEVPKIISSILDFFSDIKTKIFAALVKAVDSVSEWRGKMISFIAVEVPKIVVSFVEEFRKLPGELGKLGSDIWNGFINGLKGAWHIVTDGLKNFTDGFINGFRDALGIHSPSKVFEQFGEYIDQGLANGIIGALGYVQAAAAQLAGAVTENGNQLIDAGYTSASNYVTNFLNGLDTQWEQIDSSLQNDFLGSVQTLGNAIKNGDLETLGKWSASYFYHAMDDEQKKQILSIANGALSQLKSSLSGVWQNIAGMASSFIGQLVPATTAATTSQVGLNVAMDANPIMLVISLIGMLVGFLINLAGTNSDVAGAMGKVWKGLSNVMSFVFENIIRWLGLFIDGFIMSINVVIRAYNAIARLWGGNEIGYISNPLFEYADQIAASRKASNSASDTVDSIDKTQVPGTSEYEQATGSGSVGSYTSSSSGSNGLSEEELRRAVYNGTYNAFLDIYQRYEGQDSTPTFKVYLDGRQITSTVEKTQSERGVSIMGREVYSY